MKPQRPTHTMERIADDQAALPRREPPQREAARPSAAEGGLAQAIGHALSASAYPILRRLDIAVEQGTVVLSGQVPTYFLKQIAQELAGAAPGVQRVFNRIVVAPMRPR